MGFKFIEWIIELINGVCVVGLVLSFVVTAVVTHFINYLKSNLDISLTRKSAILIHHFEFDFFFMDMLFKNSL